MTASGCGGDPEPPEPTHTPAESVASLASYCDIQGLRQMIADGELDRSALPAWADMTEVGGTPLIVDFKKQPEESSAATLDRLYATPGLKKVRVDLADVNKCIDTTTDADIERTQGGPGYLATKEPAP